MKKGNKFTYKGKNELIIKRRRRKFIKKLSIFFILLISIMTALCLKHPYFNLKDIKILNNKNIPCNDIIKLSNIKSGENIFYVNIDQAKKNILTNPYITTVDIKRKLPNKIILSIKERIATFYTEDKGIYYIIDKDGIILEGKKNLKGMNLVKLQGVQMNNLQIGKSIPVDDERKIKVIKNISELIGNKKDNYGISLVKIDNITNIEVFYKNICIKLGNCQELDKKINKALNILQQNEKIKVAKQGYIDVSFKGNPVICVK